MRDFKITVVGHEEGWGVFTGSDGEDPEFAAWFRNKEHAERWVRDHNDPEFELHVFDPTITRTHITGAAWNDFEESPDMDILLSQRLVTG